MKQRILLSGLLCSIALVAADNGAELFQKAVTQEQAAGNLPEAIRLYQQVAKDYASNRPLAAKALIQAARCYEKLGEDKATKLYEEVARDFSDQLELANAARTKLAAMRQSIAVTMTARRMDNGNPGFGRFMIGDGQRSFFAADGYKLMVSGAAGTNQRVIHSFRPDHNWKDAVISRDLSTILLQEGPLGGPVSLALIKSDGTGRREFGQTGERVWPADWSWDNRTVVLAEGEADGGARLVKLTVADGKQEVLRKDSTGIEVVRFSPDGRFIAFTEGPAGSTNILVVPSTGGEPAVVSKGAGLLDWTHDGRYLAINGGRPDARALYLLPMKDGRAAGEPVFVRSGSIEWGMTLASGALAYRLISPPSGATVLIGSLAADGHVENWKPLELNSGRATESYPDWSPDGRQIVYNSITEDSNQRVVSVRLHDVITGDDRVLFRTNARTYQFCAWASHRPKIFCTIATSGAMDVLEIDSQSGIAEKLGSVEGSAPLQYVSPDDSALHLFVGGKRLVRWDIETHEMTPLGDGLFVSPDGKWIWTGGRPTEPQADPALQYTLQIRPVSSPEWTRVGYFKMQLWQQLNVVHVTFSFDSAWFYYHATDAAGKDALFRVSTAGGDPVRLGDFPSHTVYGTLKLTRDGRRALVVAPDAATQRSEVWLLENFEPKQPATKQESSK
jgi:hypothetical protein